MMRRYIGEGSGLGLLLGILLAANALPAEAQPPAKPVLATIVNEVTDPVPVVVTNTTAAAPALVKCWFATGSGSGSVPTGGGSGRLSVQLSVHCPDGITAMDVQRVYFSPDVMNLGTNVLHWQITVSLGPGDFDPAGLVAVLTAGAPDSVLSRPLRLDKAAAQFVSYTYRFSTGIAGVGYVSSGLWFFEGVPVP